MVSYQQAQDYITSSNCADFTAGAAWTYSTGTTCGTLNVPPSGPLPCASCATTTPIACAAPAGRFAPAPLVIVGSGSSMQTGLPSTQTWAITYLTHNYIIAQTCVGPYVYGIETMGVTYLTDQTRVSITFAPAGKYCVTLPPIPWKQPSPEDQLRAIIRVRGAPLDPRRNPYSRPLPVRSTDDIREERARATLRRVLGEKRFEGFLRTGYVTVRAKSGKCYQLFPANTQTCVYDKGQLVERLCVVLQGRFPPTDSLIMRRYLMILNSEREFRA